MMETDAYSMPEVQRLMAQRMVPMSEDELHKWLIDSFGPYQGEMAWQQLSQLPSEVRDQMLNAPSGLPDPSEVHTLMEAFNKSNLGSAEGLDDVLSQGPINVKMAASIGHDMAVQGETIRETSAVQGARVRSAVSQANLWLDAVTDFNPPTGTVDVLTRDQWVDKALPTWARFSAPVAQAMNAAMAAVVSDRFGGEIQGEIAGIFAGPVPISFPDNLKDPAKLITVLGNTSYAMQLGRAAGHMAHSIRGGFDQGIALLDNPAGALIPENVDSYATELKVPSAEVLEYLALVEEAHARLFSNVPWLMPQFDTLIDKYARGITIDLDAMEDQIRQAQEMNPDSLSGAVDLSKVGMSETPEQQEALHSLETLLALVEGWVDCVVWRAGMAHIPHLEQLREMQRRERAMGGATEETFNILLGLELRPKKMRDAAELWETITLAEGSDARDHRWSHPDLLPIMAEDALTRSQEQSKDSAEFDQDLQDLLAQAEDGETTEPENQNGSSSPQPDQKANPDESDEISSDAAGSAETSDSVESTDSVIADGYAKPDDSSDLSQSLDSEEPIDWDEELAKLLASEQGSPSDDEDEMKDEDRQENGEGREGGDDGKSGNIPPSAEDPYQPHEPQA